MTIWSHKCSVVEQQWVDDGVVCKLPPSRKRRMVHSYCHHGIMTCFYIPKRSHNFIHSTRGSFTSRYSISRSEWMWHMRKMACFVFSLSWRLMSFDPSQTIVFHISYLHRLSDETSSRQPRLGYNCYSEQSSWSQWYCLRP